MDTLKTFSKDLVKCLYLLGKQASPAYLPSLCTNESRVRSPVPALMCTWFPVQTCFRRFFSGHSCFPPASKTGPKRSKFWSEGPPGKQWYTLNKATLSIWHVSHKKKRLNSCLMSSMNWIKNCVLLCAQELSQTLSIHALFCLNSLAKVNTKLLIYNSNAMSEWIGLSEWVFFFFFFFFLFQVDWRLNHFHQNQFGANSMILVHVLWYYCNTINETILFFQIFSAKVEKKRHAWRRRAMGLWSWGTADETNNSTGSGWIERKQY